MVAPLGVGKDIGPTRYPLSSHPSSGPVLQPQGEACSLGLKKFYFALIFSVASLLRYHAVAALRPTLLTRTEF